jgi:DNA-binding NarL/FixJ family response regulator
VTYLERDRVVLQSLSSAHPSPEPDAQSLLEEGRIRVLLVDSCVMIRQALSVLIDQQPDLVTVGQSDNASSANALGLFADVIVTNIDFPDTGYIEAVAGIRTEFPASRILALSIRRHPATVRYVLASGADGYVLKTAQPTELFTGIRALARGETYLQSSLGVEFMRWNEALPTTPELSAKEERVLYLLALGNTNAEIARGTKVSLRTVETHRSRIYQKLGLRTRAELVQYARKVGLLVEPGSM